jgi:hypothetical protein
LYTLAGAPRQETKQSAAADFEGSLRQDDSGSIRLYQKPALKKRVYEASDWPGFREAVNTHKGFGASIVIKK